MGLRTKTALAGVAICLGGTAVAAPAAGAATSGWCGNDAVATDRLPDAVAGAQIHVVYATPSDGPDRFAQLAPAIVADLTEVDRWWRGQDPSRAPRFDLFAFPGCAPASLDALDVSFSRLPRPTAEYADEPGALTKISGDLAGAAFGLGSAGKKYLLYYDGQINSDAVCGRAFSSQPTSGGRFSYGAIWLQSHANCGTVGANDYAAGTAAHELLHVLGAMPTLGPPHGCPNDPGHACDSGRDIMSPSGLDFLRDQVLDEGRDDYYGHAGAWWDVQDSPWLRRLDGPQHVLTVALEGLSQATAQVVRSEFPGIGCPPSCAATWDGGSRVVLVPEYQAGGLDFLGWSGDCAAAEGSCVLDMNGAKRVVARYGVPTETLTVELRGRGRVTAATARSCSSTCRMEFRRNTELRLHAAAAKGWRFIRWARDCSGRKPDCSITVSSSSSVTAVFAKAPRNRARSR